MNLKLENTIYRMLTENTGTHFLDSGGNSNRHWQRNQNKTLQDFINEDEQIFEVDTENNEVLRIVSVFHYLAGSGSCLEFDEICNEFNELQDNPSDEIRWEKWADFEIHGVFQSGADYLEVFEDFEIERSWNTYNGESDLSQVLQGANITINGESYVIIQIHNGADVRGGYTNAKLFKLNEFQGGINEYILEYMDSYYLIEELEYIDKMTDYWDSSKVYEGEKLESIKQAIINS
tara:strand:- start:1206 stop:1907 length:702 start_codon:yes stop_codon:yes gene_type:complete